MLISEKYGSSLLSLKYGYGYDIRIHAVQSAILMLYYDVLDNIKINDINFGYYCLVTEMLIKEFQLRNGIVADGILNETTWNKIFLLLQNIKKCTLIESAPRRVTIVEIDNYIEDKIYKSNEESTIIENPDYGEIIGGITTDNEPSYNSDNTGESFIDYIKQNLPNGFDTSFFEYNSYNNLDSAKHFDELAYRYIVSGGSVYNNISFGYNIGNGGEYWHDKFLTPTYSSNGGSNKDYDYIYNLLANSIYEGNVDLSPMTVSNSASDVGNFMGSFTSSTNKPYFESTSNSISISQLKKSKFDLTIVYGAKGNKARKIIDVMPIAVTQELDASGEPIFDIYEFIAKDVIDGI